VQTPLTPAITPYKVERFNQPGPLAGVIATIDLTHPHVKIKVALADSRDPDGDGPCIGQLDTPSNAARKNDFVVTLNASFFDAPIVKELSGQKIRYFVGNCTMPVGWHLSSGKTLAKPAQGKLRATLLVMDDGSVHLQPDLREMPPKTRYAVSGNVMALLNGEIVAQDINGTRHPRSAIGISADGKTLFMVAVDGRQEGHSRGANMFELGILMKDLGAFHAINFDGGGSTSMIVKDIRTGAFAVANQPSELSTQGFPIRMERPVADVIGIFLDASVETKDAQSTNSSNRK
ncbi:MAG: phosphodiester glycosidase family protein, partial [Pseudomonadota bacterium]